MRLVAIADTHLFTEDLVVPEGDVLVHAGDMCRGGTLDELREAAAWLVALPHRHKVVVAGNHDWAFAREPAAARALFPGCTYLEDREAMVGGLRFYGAPWQPAFNDWAFNLPRGARCGRASRRDSMSSSPTVRPRGSAISSARASAATICAAASPR